MNGTHCAYFLLFLLNNVLNISEYNNIKYRMKPTLCYIYIFNGTTVYLLFIIIYICIIIIIIGILLQPFMCINIIVCYNVIKNCILWHNNIEKEGENANFFVYIDHNPIIIILYTIKKIIKYT